MTQVSACVATHKPSCRQHDGQIACFRGPSFFRHISPGASPVKSKCKSRETDVQLCLLPQQLVKALAAGQALRRNEASQAALAEAEAFYGIAGLGPSREEPAYTAEHLQFKRALHALQCLQAQAKQTPSEVLTPQDAAF